MKPKVKIRHKYDSVEIFIKDEHMNYRIMVSRIGSYTVVVTLFVHDYSAGAKDIDPITEIYYELPLLVCGVRILMDNEYTELAGLLVEHYM